MIHLGREKGPLVSVHLDYVSRQSVRNIKIVGDEGTLYWDLNAKILQKITAKGREILMEDPQGFDVSLTYKNAMAQFLDNLKGTADPKALPDALATAELMLECKAAGL